MAVRSTRMPKASKTRGKAYAMRPSVPAVTACTTSPTTPGRPHHSRAATTTASAMSANPTPSRRWSGPMSRAAPPTRRAAPPATCATPIQAPRAARSGRPPPFAPRGRRARGVLPRPEAGREPDRAEVPEPGWPAREALDGRVAMVRRLRQCHLRLTCHTRIAAVARRPLSHVPGSRRVAVGPGITDRYGLSQGHERQRQAPARWTATLLPRWGAPGDDLVRRRLAAGKRGPASLTRVHGLRSTHGRHRHTRRAEHHPRTPQRLLPRPGTRSAAPRAASQQPGIRAGARRGGHPTSRHDQRRAGRPDGVRTPGVRQPRPRRLDAGPRGRQGGRRPRAADLLLGAPGQRLRQPRDERMVRAGPRRGGPLRRGAGRTTRWSSRATRPTRGGCSPGCCPPTRPSWCSRRSTTPPCCRGRPSGPCRCRSRATATTPSGASTLLSPRSRPSTGSSSSPVRPTSPARSGRSSASST